jgi:hypothetical protein
MKDQSEGAFSSVIPANQYGVLHAELCTGIVTDQYGHRALMDNIQDNFQYLILQRDIDHLGLLLFRFSDFSVRLR